MSKSTRRRRRTSRNRCSRRPLPQLGNAAAILPRRRVARLARSTGFIQRQRRVVGIAIAFLLALVYGTAVESIKSMDGFRRFYSSITKINLARSAFQKRFSKASVSFFRAVFQEAILRHSVRLGSRLAGKLAAFRDVCAIDATVIRLNDLLEKTYAATRTNHTKAAAKLHAVLSLSKKAVVDLAVSAERVSDREFLKTKLFWVTGRLLLFDLGYYEHALFHVIHRVGGFFLSRLKQNANPTIVAVRCGIARGQKAVGKRLRDVRFAEGRTVDLDVRVGVSLDNPVFRLVGVFNAECDRWHFYLTNLPVADFGPEELALMYRLRWEIELLFKELKGIHRLEEIKSGRQEVVLTMLYASLLSLLATRVLGRLVEERDAGNTPRLSLRILSSYLIQHALTLAKEFLHGRRRLQSVLKELLEDIGQTCRDPNPQRPSVLARHEC